MRRFAALCCALEAAASDDARLAALAGYLESVPPADVAWAAYLLSGRRMKRVVRARDMRAAAEAAAGVPGWLFDASREAVGDVAETAALLVPSHSRDDDRGLAHWIEHEIAPLAGLSSLTVAARLREAWDVLGREARRVYNKLVAGEFRSPVAKALVARALATIAGVREEDVARRLAGKWRCDESFIAQLKTPVASAAPDTDAAQPAIVGAARLRAVLVYAQPGRGRHAGLHAEFTFAVRDGNQLVTIAKTSEGLSDDEVRDLDAWVRRHTLERFGPVRRVDPVLVFEIAYDGVLHSARRRGGVALNRPRVVATCAGDSAVEADTIDVLRNGKRNAAPE
jgi:ATP-dependent DNA ligase